MRPRLLCLTLLISTVCPDIFAQNLDTISDRGHFAAHHRLITPAGLGGSASPSLVPLALEADQGSLALTIGSSVLFGTAGFFVGGLAGSGHRCHPAVGRRLDHQSLRSAGSPPQGQERLQDDADPRRDVGRPSRRGTAVRRLHRRRTGPPRLPHQPPIGQRPASGVALALSAYSDRKRTIEAIKAGAVGYILKDIRPALLIDVVTRGG